MRQHSPRHFQRQWRTMKRKHREANVYWCSRAEAGEEMKEESQAAWKEMDIEEHMQKYLDQGMDKKKR